MEKGVSKGGVAEKGGVKEEMGSETIIMSVTFHWLHTGHL